MYILQRPGTDDPQPFFYERKNEHQKGVKGPLKREDVKTPLDFDEDMIALDSKAVLATLPPRRADELLLEDEAALYGLYLSRASLLSDEELLSLDEAGAIFPVELRDGHARIFRPFVSLTMENTGRIDRGLFERFKTKIPFTIISGDAPWTASLKVTSGRWRDALTLTQAIWEAKLPKVLVSPHFLNMGGGPSPQAA